jgi:hypothetical protein
MKHQAKLSEKQEHVVEQQAQAQTAKEFTNSDELLRFDATHTVVPAEIAQRLKKTTAQIRPAESRPWWKHLFGR